MVLVAFAGIETVLEKEKKGGKNEKRELMRSERKKKKGKGRTRKEEYRSKQ